MKKILLMPKSIEEIEKTKKSIDGYIIGLKNYSVNINLSLDLEDLKKIRIDNEIFIAINKNLNSKDISNIEKILLQLNELKIKGVLFYDIGVLNIYRKLKLNYDLILSQEHLSTNYKTINYYEKFGIKNVYISSDITTKEINEIKEKTNTKILVNLFGYIPMFTSKRHIVKNYLEHFNLSDNSKINYIEKENNIYPIIDNDEGTCVYSANILNGLKESLIINYDYGVINSFNIENIEDVIEIFKQVNEKNIDELNNKLLSMYKNLDDGFFNKKTVFKVKK